MRRPPPALRPPSRAGDAPFHADEAPFHAGSAPFRADGAPFRADGELFHAGRAPFRAGGAPFRSALVALALLGAALALVAAPALAAGPKGAAKAPPPGAPVHPAVARVEVLFRRDAALVTTDLTFVRSPDYRGAELAAFVAYGAPGLPRAFEARLVPVERGRFSPAEGEGGEALAAAHATHAPDGVALALGGAHRAGQALRLPAAALERAFAPSGLAALRLRAVHLFRDGGPRASLVVRLSAPPGAAPYPLGEVSVRGDGVALRNPVAALCRPAGADLSLALSGVAPPPGALAPPRAPRTAGDELCVSAEFEARAAR